MEDQQIIQCGLLTTKQVLHDCNSADADKNSHDFAPCLVSNNCSLLLINAFANVFAFLNCE